MGLAPLTRAGPLTSRLSENKGENKMIENDIARTVNSNWKIRRKYLLIISIIPSYILLLAASLVLFSNTALAAWISEAGSYLNQEYAPEMQMELEEAGYSTYMAKVESEGKEFTGVIVDVNGSLKEMQNVGTELVQKGLTEEPSPIADERDTDLLEILGKRRYLPRKTTETNPKIENVLLLYTEPLENQINPLTTWERAQMFKDLVASHWSLNIYMKLASEYEQGDIDDFDVLMYIGENYLSKIPKSLINDVNNTDKEILWINYYPWELDSRKLGFKVSGAHSFDFDRISYRGYDFKLNPTDTSLIEVIDPKKAKVLAWLVDNESGKSIPAIVNANDNFLYVSYLPLAVPYLDEPIPFFNALHETFGHHEKDSEALLRLEDIHAESDFDDLAMINELLKEKRVLPHLAVIPVYVNPEKNINTSILDRPQLINVLKDILSDNGTLVLHGYTHQYDGVTGIDYEFWDESKNKPVEEDSEEFVQERVISALNILRNAGLSTDIWETPHYTASDLDYKVFERIFPIIYDSRHGINVPFVFRRGNTTFSPIDLGYVFSTPSMDKIIADARKIHDCFEDPSISFFWHPYLTGNEELGIAALEKIIDSLTEIGYQFHSIYDLLEKERSFQEKVISAKRSFQKGVTLPAYSKDKYFSYQINEELDNLADIGVEWVRIQTFLYQNNIHSSSIFADRNKTASDESLEYIVNKLHQNNFKVLFEPVVSLEHTKSGEWMGTIAPDNWDSWFESYNNLIEHYAKLAQKNEVEQFVVGVELNSTHRFKEKWEQIISNVRKHYQGLTIFVANFDAYETVSFWDKLDAIGMNFYFPINRRDDLYLPWSEVKDDYNDPSYEDLLEGWQLWVNTLDIWQEKISKPIVVTEIGYVSQRGCTYQPWSWYLGEADYEEQYLAYKALFEVWGRKQVIDGKFDGGNYIQGVYFFGWDSEKPENDRSYIPSEAAKSIIREWFKASDTS